MSAIFGGMALLVVYVLVALVFSFLCSIAEAVLLSVTIPYIVLLERRGRPAGKLLAELKARINQPLTAILTLNTIAHTVGAAGAGAQVAAVFGNVYLGAASVVLTGRLAVNSHPQSMRRQCCHWELRSYQCYLGGTTLGSSVLPLASSLTVYLKPAAGRSWNLIIITHWSSLFGLTLLDSNSMD